MKLLFRLNKNMLKFKSIGRVGDVCWVGDQTHALG
jgi:hypothetical protein